MQSDVRTYTCIHKFTGVTAFFFMYSREACLLAELVYGSIETDKPIAITDFVSIRTDSFG